MLPVVYDNGLLVGISIHGLLHQELDLGGISTIDPGVLKVECGMKAIFKFYD